MGIRIDRITLREIRMPLVHFFETSFGRTTERRMVLVEVSSDGISGWGEVTAGENPFYNEEWTESCVADPARLCCAPRSSSRFRKRRRCRGADRAHPRTPDGARWAGGRGVGSGSAGARQTALPTHRRRRAARDSLRSIHRHPGHRAAAVRERSKPNWRPAISASR